MNKAIVWGVGVLVFLILLATATTYSIYKVHKAYGEGYKSAQAEFNLALAEANLEHNLNKEKLEKKYEKLSRVGISRVIKQLHSATESKNSGQACRELCGVDSQPKQEHFVTCINEEDGSGSQGEGKYLYTLPEIRQEANAVDDPMYQLRDSSLKQETYIEHGIEVDKGLTKGELDSFSELFNQKLTKEK